MEYVASPPCDAVAPGRNSGGDLSKEFSGTGTGQRYRERLFFSAAAASFSARAFSRSNLRCWKILSFFFFRPLFLGIIDEGWGCSSYYCFCPRWTVMLGSSWLFKDRASSCALLQNNDRGFQCRRVWAQMMWEYVRGWGVIAGPMIIIGPAGECASAY